MAGSGQAPINAYGVGTKMGVSADAPFLDSAYKLVAYAGRPVMKLSPGKATVPGVGRFSGQAGGTMIGLWSLHGRAGRAYGALMSVRAWRRASRRLWPGRRR